MRCQILFSGKIDKKSVVNLSLQVEVSFDCFVFSRLPYLPQIVEHFNSLSDLSSDLKKSVLLLLFSIQSAG